MESRKRELCYIGKTIKIKQNDFSFLINSLPETESKEYKNLLEFIILSD